MSVGRATPGGEVKARFPARWRLLAWLLCASAPLAARAQGAADSARTTAPPNPARWTFGGWVAGATGQPLETRVGHVHDRDLFFTAWRAMHPLVTTPRFQLRSTVDLFPLVVATANREYTLVQRSICAPDGYCVNAGDVLVSSRRTAYAAGIAPLGFEGIIGVSRWFGISAGVEGGALYFNRRIPDPGEERFNFVADGHLALRVSLGGRRPTLVGGFRINHISNGGTGPVNPGMDSRLVFVGVER